MTKKTAKRKYVPEQVDPADALTIEALANPLFDKVAPRKRLISARPEISHLVEPDYDAIEDAEERYMMLDPDSYGFDDAEEAYMTADFQRKEPVIEGVTTTDQFNVVGFTYHATDGMLFVNYLDQQKGEDVRLIEKVIRSYDDFDKCLKLADRKIQRVRDKKYGLKR